KTLQTNIVRPNTKAYEQLDRPFEHSHNEFALNHLSHHCLRKPLLRSMHRLPGDGAHCLQPNAMRDNHANNDKHQKIRFGPFERAVAQSRSENRKGSGYCIDPEFPLDRRAREPNTGTHFSEEKPEEQAKWNHTQETVLCQQSNYCVVRMICSWNVLNP